MTKETKRPYAKDKPNFVAQIDIEEWEKPRMHPLKVGGKTIFGEGLEVKITHIVEMKNETYVFGVWKE